jgi:hypothetical protein
VGSVKDATRARHPKTATSPKINEKVMDLIATDARFTTRYIAKCVGISVGPAHTILRRGLAFMSPSERYITKYGQPKEFKDFTEQKRTMRVQKVLHVIFFTNQGHAIQIAIPNGKSANAKFYKGKSLDKLKTYFQKPSTSNWSPWCQVVA